MKLCEGGVGIVHRYRRESLESIRMLCNQLRISVVQDPGHFRLTSFVAEKNIWSRKRDHFNIDAYAIHVFEAPVDVGHRRRHSEEARASMGDDRAAGRIFSEREVRRSIANHVKEDFGIVVSMY